MSQGILFLVLPERSVTKVQSAIHGLTVPEGRRFVQILSDAHAATLSTDVYARTAQNLAASISAYPKHQDNRLIVGHEVRCSYADLSDWWITHNFGDRAVKKLKPTPLIREVTEHLEKTGQHWRVHALAELKHFDGRQSELDAWLQQFGELGCGDIGRKIAARLRVIRTNEFQQSVFAIRIAEAVGHRQAHCYVKDNDAGGSWLEMQALLTHACPPESVYPVEWNEVNNRLVFPDALVDEFVIYEDGLWSGTEATQRLQAIKAESLSAPVKLRFGVVTDFGLMVARQAIRSLGLGGRVSVDSSDSEYFCFLKQDIPEALRLGLGMSPENYFKELHPHVEPFAFQVSQDWSAQEIQICKEIGIQLVRRWLSQRGGEPSAEKIERFALGGGQFASTIVFSRSVPKVCLPLLWLDGKVELNGKNLDWKPLLVDARRVSDRSLLLTGNRA